MITARGELETCSAQCHQHGALDVSLFHFMLTVINTPRFLRHVPEWTSLSVMCCSIMISLKSMKRKFDLQEDAKSYHNHLLLGLLLWLLTDLAPLFISSPMCLLVDTVQSNTLICSFTNAERMCLRESQAAGNLYLAGGLDMLFPLLCCFPLCGSELTWHFVLIFLTMISEHCRADGAEHLKVSDHTLRSRDF